MPISRSTGRRRGAIRRRRTILDGADAEADEGEHPPGAAFAQCLAAVRKLQLLEAGKIDREIATADDEEHTVAVEGRAFAAGAADAKEGAAAKLADDRGVVKERVGWLDKGARERVGQHGRPRAAWLVLGSIALSA
jgi:hypothetical protein